MSNNKTRREKILAEQRKKAREEKLRELETLKAKALSLQENIKEAKKENLKQFNIRNLKVVGSTCNFVAPFILTAGLTTGIFYIFNGGLPFHTDTTTKYMLHNLDYTTDGDISTDDTYQTDRWSDKKPDDELIVYTPWELNDENQYTRYKREYTIDSSDMELYNAVLDNNYDYISEHFSDFKEEIEMSNVDIGTNNNQYYFEASLHFFDKDDTIHYDETSTKNIAITLAELGITLLGGACIAHFRDFDYLDSIRSINREYKWNTRDVKPMKRELSETNNKILTLSSKGGNHR